MFFSIEARFSGFRVALVPYTLLGVWMHLGFVVVRFATLLFGLHSVFSRLASLSPSRRRCGTKLAFTSAHISFKMIRTDLTA